MVSGIRQEIVFVNITFVMFCEVFDFGEYLHFAHCILNSING